ncbi:MAG: hypothetical protein ABR910_14350 [Acidobacteriaceae bacterium]|jgi:peptidoglycan/LPS O-acetylase OafA/YrhL
MTRTAINDSLWALGLLLQCSLLALLFARGIARRLPLFTLLLAFYVLRSALLFTLSGHLDSDTYAVTYNSLAAADLFLQLLVALEIAAGLVHASGGWLRRWVELLLLPCAAFVATFLLCQLLPANSRVPPDRMQLFNWFVIVLLGLWAAVVPQSTPASASLPRRLLLGLGSYALLGICVTVVRLQAAAHRDAVLFARSSYILPVAWLLVVLYWIAALKSHVDRPAPLLETPLATA